MDELKIASTKKHLKDLRNPNKSYTIDAKIDTGVLVQDLITPNGNHIIVILAPLTIVSMEELEDALIETALKKGM